MSNTTKTPSSKDANQTLQNSFNDVDSSITTNGFLTGKVGRKITVSITTTTVANDTQVFTFLESGSTLYVLTLVYTDATLATLISAERTA